MPPTLIITPTLIDIAVGESFQLVVSPNPNGVKWTCDTCSVASVDNNGVVTGLKEGTAIITGRRGNQSVSVTVGVSDVPPATPSPEPPVAHFSIDQLISVAFPVTIDTTGTFDPNNNLVGGTINWGDGVPDSWAMPLSQFFNHTYASAGEYTITFIAQDSTGLFASLSRTIELLGVDPTPEPPVAVLAVTVQADAGQPSTISTVGSTGVGGATLVGYSVAWGDDETTASTPGTATTPPATLDHTYALAGTYVVTLTVLDDQGLEASSTATLIVQAAPPPPAPPVAQLTYVAGADGTVPYEFDTTGTSIGLTNYSMDWGDGTAPDTGNTDVPATLTHAYADPGTYAAGLTVTKSGLTATAAALASIAEPPTPPPPPTAALSYVSGSFAGQPYTLSTLGTTTGLLNYSLNWGDGTPPAVGTNVAIPAQLSHTYLTANVYTAVLTVTTASGSALATIPITIQTAPTTNQPPIAALALTSGTFVGDTFNFSTTGTQDLDGLITSYLMTFGDGAVQQNTGAPPATFSHVYTSAATVTASLRVTDNSGAMTTFNLPLTVFVVPDVGGGANAYFDLVRLRADCFASYNLRNASQVQTLLTQADRPAGDWAYIYSTDPYPLRQDACRVRIRQGRSSPAGRLQLPAGPTNGQNFFFTSDLWIGSEWGDPANLLVRHKNYSPVGFVFNGAGPTQYEVEIEYPEAVRFPANLPPGGPYIAMLFPHMNGLYVKNPTFWRSGASGFPSARLPYGAPSNQQRHYEEAIQPFDTATYSAGQEFGLVAARWHRLWNFFERAPSEDWTFSTGVALAAYKWSFWFADTVRPATRVLHEGIVGLPATSTGFVLAYLGFDSGGVNQPANAVVRGDLIAYERNAIVLHGISRTAALSLLQQPVA